VGSVPLQYSLKEFVDSVIGQAERDLLAFPHQDILKALKSHPEGIPPAYFKKQKSKGVDLSNPKDVGVALKRSNALVYRIDRGLYCLMSTAHKTALKSYEPIL
jgi:hypothetical protein